MNWAKLRNRKDGWRMCRDTKPALPGRALLKVKVKVYSLSKSETEHQDHPE
jgi:hypothetical protein